MEYNWIAVQRQRFLVVFDEHKDVKAVAYNKGDLHGRQGIDDPTGQRWYGFALLHARHVDKLDEEDSNVHNVYTAFGEMPDFSSIRACIEEDLTKEANRKVIDPFNR